jgi:flagellar biosynthesis protein FlhG
MLGKQSSRLVTFVSAASPADKQTLLVNLAACLNRVGSDVVLFDACHGEGGAATQLAPASAASLLEAARGLRPIDDVRHMSTHGFGIAALTRGAMPTAADQRPLADAFERLARGCSVLLADAELDEHGDLPITAMGKGEIVVQVFNHPDSIVKAYGVIKRLNARLGRSSFAVLVCGASDMEAKRVHANMAQAANRYLALELRSVGSVPADSDLQRASLMARPVIDAFPMAAAAQAMRRLATYFLAPGVSVPVTGRPHANDHLVIAGV